MSGSPFPPDILALLNDHTPGTGAPVQPSAEVTEARSKKLTVEDVKLLQEETAAELYSEAQAEPQPEPDMVELFSRGLV